MSSSTSEIDTWIEKYKASHPKQPKRAQVKPLPQRIAEAKRRGFTNVLVPVDQAEKLLKVFSHKP